MKKLSFMIALFLLCGLGYAQKKGVPPTTKAARTAYANIIGGTETGYFSFLLDDFAGKTKISDALRAMGTAQIAHAGEFFEGKLYGYFCQPSTYQPYNNTVVAIFDALTGVIGKHPIYDGNLAGINSSFLAGKAAHDAAYDYSADALYLLWGDNALYTAGTTVATYLDLTFAVNITGVSGTLLTLAIDVDGNMYGISDGDDAKLYKIDQTTGAATLIGSTGKKAHGFQSMNYNHYEDVLYWCQADTLADGTLNSALMTVNTTSGAATLVQENIGRITCFHIPYSTNFAAPQAVSNLKLRPGNPTSADALKVTFNWNNPSLDIADEPLTELTAINIYDSAGTTLLHSVTEGLTIGETASYQLTVAAAGTHYFQIVAANSSGEGNKVVVSCLVGQEDVPEALTILTFTKTDNPKTATVTWTTPEVGEKGGWIDTSTLKYTVKRLAGGFEYDPEIDTFTLTTNSMQTTFNDDFSTGGFDKTWTHNYRYMIIPSTDLGSGRPAVSDMQLIGKPFTVPYEMKFEKDTAAIPTWKENYGAWSYEQYQKAFELVDENGVTHFISNGWTYAWQLYGRGYGAMRSETFEGPKDDYLFSPKITLEEGKTYVAKFWVGSLSPNPPEKMAVYLATEQTKSSIIGEAVYVNDNISTQIYRHVQCEVFITGKPAGDYVFAFHSFGSGTLNLYFDDFTLEEIGGNDLIAGGLVGSSTPMVGKPFIYKVFVKNNSGSTQSGYSVKLVNGAGTQVAGNNKTSPIAPGETVILNLLYTPTAAISNDSLYAVVEMPDEENTGNNKTNTLKISIAAAEPVFTGTIGTEPTQIAFPPFAFATKSSVMQSIYFNHELIGQGGMITELQFFNNFVSADVTNKPIKVWLKNTTISSLKDLWVPESEFTLVYDGTMTFPKGQNTISIVLDEAFEYTGQNIVVMTRRPMEDQYYNVGDGFVNSNDPYFPERTHWYSSSLTDFTFAPNQVGIVDPTYPKMVFKMGLESGRVFGTVTEEVNGKEEFVEGVTIRIAGQNAYATTDEYGGYEFTLSPGDYTFTASKHGYLAPPASALTTVTNGSNSAVDFQLTRVSAYAVSGKIIGSDAPNGVQGVQIKLSGYANYTTTTDASGNYSFPDVYGGHTYTMTTRVSGYFNDTSEIEVTAAKTHDRTLQAKAFAVANPKAEVSGDNALVSWDAPSATDYQTLTLDDGSPEYGLAFNPGRFQMAGNQFITGDTGIVTSVDLYGITNPKNTNKPLTVEIYDSARNKIGGSEPFLMPEEAWINVPVDNVSYSGQFYAMVVWSEADGYSNYLGDDQNGPNANKNIDWGSDGNAWTLMSAMLGAPNAFMVRANVSVPDIVRPANAPAQKTYQIAAASVQPETLSKSTAPVNDNAIYPNASVIAKNAVSSDRRERSEQRHCEERSDEAIKGLDCFAIARNDGRQASNDGDVLLRYEGLAIPTSVNVEAQYAAFAQKAAPTPLKYQVYRLLEGANESAWSLLNDAVTATSYTDVAYSTLTAGVYQYAIKAVYVNNNISQAKLTNILAKDMIFTVKVAVTTNSGVSANGAEVKLTPHDQNPARVYTATVANDTATFAQVWKGNYSVLITLDGFEPYVSPSLAVENNTTYQATLFEFKKPPFALRVDETSNPKNRLFSWNNIYPLQRVGYWTEPENYSELNAMQIEDLGFGTGVIFDLSKYPFAKIDSFEFYHIPIRTGQTGLYGYGVHIIDVSAGTHVYNSPILKTTGDNKWEKIALDYDEDLGGKQIAIIVEPLTLENNLYHPMLGSDAISQNSHSFYVNMEQGALNIIPPMNGQTFGEFLANLWIDVNEETENISANGTKSFTEYAVYLDDEEKATTTELHHEFTDLEENKTYTAGVEAVYSTGVSELVTIKFSTGSTGIVITSQDKFTVYPNPVTDIVSIETTQTITEINVFDQNGRIVKTQKGNQKTLDLQNLPTGQYVVRIHAGNAIVPVKIIKK